MTSLLNIIVLVSFASFSASGMISTLNAKTILCFSPTALSSIISFLKTCPIFAFLMGTFRSESTLTIASRLPIVSVLIMTPSFSVSISMLSISLFTSCFTLSIVDMSCIALNGTPAITPSRSDAEILTPDAATTSGCDLNCFSTLISFIGLVLRSARAFVVLAPDGSPITRVSPERISPS